ncbi:MAG: hypothetical protein O2962_04460 [Cyanobacteria bacterium]|nr:hypothetical protein [Cyanobacteriota bacterium]
MYEEGISETSTEKKPTAKAVAPKKPLMTEPIISETHNLPAILSESPDVLEASIKKIEQHLNSLMKQQSGVSAEFNALMDGYVNKANESQEFKVRYESLNSQVEDLKNEYKTLKINNKKYKDELEAAKEALRASESDLQRSHKDILTQKKHYDEQIYDYTEERERLKTKLKQLTDYKDKSTTEYNKLKTEFLEMQYQAKQNQQEKNVATETADRAVKESHKIVDELKDKLELRTREIEYKDALLNQLIKQISADDSIKDAMRGDIKNIKPERPRQETRNTDAIADFGTEAPNGLKIKDPSSRTWGSFRN